MSRRQQFGVANRAFAMMRQLSVLLFFVVLLWAIESHAGNWRRYSYWHSGNFHRDFKFSVKSCRIRSDPSIRGRCVPVEQCRQMFSNLVSLQFQPNFSYKDYLDERICDYGANGVSKVRDFATLTFQLITHGIICNVCFAGKI